MRKTGFTLLSASVVLTTLAVANSALAQDPAAPPAAPPPPAAAPPAAPPEAAAPEAPPAEAAPPPPPVEAAPPPPPPEAAPPPPPPEALPPPPPPEEPAPPTPAITGFVEGAYHRNLTDPHNVRTPFTHVYDTNNSFLLHMAHVALNHSFTEWASGTIEIDGGTDAFINSGGAGLFDLQEAYATLSAPFGLSVVAGKFATYEGIELIEGPLNPTITRGFLYVLAEPVTHTGVKVHYDFQGMVNVGVGLVNGWDVMNDNNDGKTFIWRIGTTPIPEFFAGFSGTYGPELGGNEDSKRLSLDLTGGVVVGPVTINFQGNYGSESELIDPATGEEDSASWLGFGVQPVLALDNGFSLGARFEYFADSDGYRAGVDDTNYMNFTIVPGYTIDGWTVRGEYRLDTASEDVFVESDGVDVTGSQSTMAIGIHYVF